MGIVIGDKELAGAVIGDKTVGGMVLMDKVIFRSTSTAPTENAMAPTLAIGAVTSVNEGVPLTLTTAIAGGVYDTIAYAWSIITGGGTIVGNGDTAVYTSGAIDADQATVVRCTVTVTGTGTLAVNGTTDTVTDNEFFTVINQAALPDATVGVTIRDVASTGHNTPVTLTADITGTFDEIAGVQWNVQDGQGTITAVASTSLTTRSAVYTPGASDPGNDVTVHVTVSVRGTGTNAADTTTASANDDEVFAVDAVPLPNAAAPTITIGNQGSVSELVDTITLTATISGGTYDAITYAWEVAAGEGTIVGNGLSATYTVPNVDADTDVTVRVTATATGDGTNAVNGTSDTATDDEEFTVNHISGVVRFPAGAVYAGLAYHPSTGDLVMWDTTNEQIVRRSRGNVADSSISLSDVPDGVTYRDIAVDVSGQFHLWRNLGSGATVDRYSSTGAYQSTVSMATNGGPSFALDIQSNDYISLNGTTLRVWEHDGTVRAAHTIATALSDEDVIVDFIQATATHVWLVSDGHRVNLSTGATDVGLDASWPQPAPGLAWQFGYEDPTTGGAIWLARSDGVAYRVGSGATVPGTPLSQDDVVQLFRDAGLAVYAGTMGLPQARTGGNPSGQRFVIFDPNNNQGAGATGSWDAQHDVTDVPVLDRMQWFGDLDRFVFNRSGSVDFEDWANISTSRVYMVRISSGTDDVNEYLCIGPSHDDRGGGSSWLNIMPRGGANDDWMRVSHESKHGSIEGTVMEPGDTTIPGLLDDRWNSWVEAEWDVATTGRQFVVAFGASDTPVPLVAP